LETHLVIINPNAGRKLGQRDWPVISKLLEDAGIPFRHEFTKGRFDANALARDAVAKGCKNIITVGGDGTFNEVVNAVLLQKETDSKGISLAFIPVGTGNDWGKMYSLPSEYDEAVKVISENKTVLQDAGLASYTSDKGIEKRYFANVAGIGLDAVVVFDTNLRKERGSGGKTAYLLSLLKAMLRYSSLKAKIVMDGDIVFEGYLYSANVGICKYSGGGMQQVPNAIPDDGLFDITIISKVSKGKVILNVKGLYDGSFTKLKEVSTHRGASIQIDSSDPLLLEVDGESLGRPPFNFSILEKVLRIVVPVKDHKQEN
jgi:YegS/Rv2252/BmrU family lipid kinase